MADEHPLLALAGVRVMADEACILDLPVLSIAAGENTAILGANGSGKSTLVKLIARELYPAWGADVRIFGQDSWNVRSEEHTSELQSLMRNSYAVFCLKKKKNKK